MISKKHSLLLSGGELTDTHEWINKEIKLGYWNSVTKISLLVSLLKLSRKLIKHDRLHNIKIKRLSTHWPVDKKRWTYGLFSHISKVFSSWFVFSKAQAFNIITANVISL
jgi:hypothetical protein